MTTLPQGIIEPGARRFTPRAGTWLAAQIAETKSRLAFVSAEDDPTLIIGSVHQTGTRYQGRYYAKPLRITTTAKSEPTDFQETTYKSVSQAVFDIRRKYNSKEDITPR